MIKKLKNNKLRSSLESLESLIKKSLKSLKYLKYFLYGLKYSLYLTPFLFALNAYAICPNAKEFWKGKTKADLKKAVKIVNPGEYELNLTTKLGQDVSNAIKECYNLGHGFNPEKIVLKNDKVEIYFVDIKDTLIINYEKGTKELLQPPSSWLTKRIKLIPIKVVKTKKTKKRKKEIVPKKLKEEFSYFTLNNFNNLSSKFTQLEASGDIKKNNFSLLPYLGWQEKRLPESQRDNEGKFGVATGTKLNFGKKGLEALALLGSLGFRLGDGHYFNSSFEGSGNNITQTNTEQTSSKYGFFGGFAAEFSWLKKNLKFGLGSGVETSKNVVNDKTIQQVKQEQSESMQGVNVYTLVDVLTEAETNVTARATVWMPQATLEALLGDENSKVGKHKMFVTYGRIIKKGSVGINQEVDVATQVYTRVSYDGNTEEFEDTAYEPSSTSSLVKQGDIAHYLGLIYNFSKDSWQAFLDFSKLAGEQGSKTGRNYDVSLRGIIPFNFGAFDVAARYQDSERNFSILFLSNSNLKNYGKTIYDDFVLNHTLYLPEEVKQIEREYNDLTRKLVHGWKLGSFVIYDKKIAEVLKAEIGVEGGYSNGTWFIYAKGSNNGIGVDGGAKIEKVLLGGKIEYKREPSKILGEYKIGTEHSINAKVYITF